MDRMKQILEERNNGKTQTGRSAGRLSGLDGNLQRFDELIVMFLCIIWSHNLPKKAGRIFPNLDYINKNTTVF